MILSNTFKDGVFYGEQNFNLPYHMNVGGVILEHFSMYKEKTALVSYDYKSLNSQT